MCRAHISTSVACLALSTSVACLAGLILLLLLVLLPLLGRGDRNEFIMPSLMPTSPWSGLGLGRSGSLMGLLVIMMERPLDGRNDCMLPQQHVRGME